MDTKYYSKKFAYVMKRNNYDVTVESEAFSICLNFYVFHSFQVVTNRD